MDHNDAAQLLRLPDRFQSVRAKPPKMAEVNRSGTEIPLIDPKGPKEAQVKEYWTAKVRTFRLSEDADRQAYEDIWQAVCDGLAVVSEHRLDFDATNSCYLAFLRWASISYKV
jgi:hypothetical protein